MVCGTREKSFRKKNHLERIPKKNRSPKKRSLFQKMPHKSTEGTSILKIEKKNIGWSRTTISYTPIKLYETRVRRPIFRREFFPGFDINHIKDIKSIYFL